MDLGAGGAVYNSIFFDGLTLNSSGDVFFVAGLANTEVLEEGGIFTDSVAGPGNTLVLQGSIAPDTDGGTLSLPGPNPSANDSGVVTFFATVRGGSSRNGVFVHSEGQTSVVALSDDPAPGTDGGVYGGFSRRRLINASGSVAYLADVSSGSAARGIFLVPEPQSVTSTMVALGTTLLIARARRRKRASGQEYFMDAKVQPV